LIGDGDRRNPTLSGLYPPGTPGGAFQPASDDPAEIRDWLTGMLARMVEEATPLMLDFSGGDPVLAEYGQDLALVEFCEGVGFEPLALLVSGPEPDDFEHVARIWRARYFRPRRAILVLNDHCTAGAGRRVRCGLRFGTRHLHVAESLLWTRRF
jgi:hypothetical protein